MHSDKTNEVKNQQYLSVYLDKCKLGLFVLFLVMQFLLSVKGFPNETEKNQWKEKFL